MKRIKLTQGKFALVDDDDFNKLSKYKWCLVNVTNNCKYAVTTIKCKQFSMHRVIMNIKNSNIFVDHINRNGLDNRKENLRIVSCSENAMNASIRSDNKSGFKGIYWNKLSGKWHTQIWFNKKCIYLGSYDSLNLAKIIRKLGEIEYFGDYAAK